jgi:nucleoside-diphosphate-sugar epimerase
MSRILVTGANGFVGQALCRRLLLDDHSVIATVRRPESGRDLPSGIAAVFVKPLTPETNWTDALSSIDAVIHLAARVHVTQESAADPLAEFRRVNLHGTRRLIQSALDTGVKRFVFLSTIGVNGNSTTEGNAFSAHDTPAPHNPYSESKLQAEQALLALTEGTAMQHVIIRAPLVYGPANPGNALRLFCAVHKRRPFPFASVHNRRSLIYVGNLADVLSLCSAQPLARGLYLVSDRQDVSTPELIGRIAVAFGVPPRLFPFPPTLMFAAAGLLGKRDVVERLIGSLAVDSSKIVRDLGWKPPYSMEEGLTATAKWYLSTQT